MHMYINNVKLFLANSSEISKIDFVLILSISIKIIIK